jgi:hypothetical protein
VSSVEEHENPLVEGVLVLDYVKPHPNHRHDWGDEVVDEHGIRKRRCACGGISLGVPVSRWRATKLLLQTLVDERRSK